MNSLLKVFCFLLSLWLVPGIGPAATPLRRTSVSIVGEDFYINGNPTYSGRLWNGHTVQGLLMNSRMVQAIFDDRNKETVKRWAYPDTRRWDPERNTREFIAAMATWRKYGLLAVSLNLQGGSPEGYSSQQPWHNSAIDPDGTLHPESMRRLERVINRADELGMVVILGYFYFGQDERLQDEASVLRATDGMTQWLLERRYRNVLVEINNECNINYDHEILRPRRVHELIERVKNTSRDGRRLLVSTSFGGGTVPSDGVVRAADFILLHGNGVGDPSRIAEMVRQTRKLPSYWPKPIVFNEDDHFDFNQPANNMIAAVAEHASWGYFDPGKSDYRDGYQSPPVNWTLSTPRKKEFFTLLSQITGAAAIAFPSEPDWNPTPLRKGNALVENKAPSVTNAPGVVITQTNYHGWSDAIILSNNIAKAIIVPAIGRLMQFRFANEEGLLWENRDLDGRKVDTNSSTWINFGGDKSWPAPQSDWPKISGRGWPPPAGFDATPVEARIKGNIVTLVSPTDPHYGIRTIRHFELDDERPVLTVWTTYEKVVGDPIKVAVWIITQMRDPIGVYVPLPAQSIFTNGYNLQSEHLPANLTITNGFIRMTRDPHKAAKIGSDSGSMLWVGEKSMLRVDAPREKSAEYPDNGSSVEVYTNGDPLPYVELETLGPLKLMKIGSKIDQVNTYTLFRRRSSQPDEDAQKVLQR